eukprot:s1543_g4.t1
MLRGLVALDQRASAASTLILRASQPSTTWGFEAERHGTRASERFWTLSVAQLKEVGSAKDEIIMLLTLLPHLCVLCHHLHGQQPSQGRQQPVLPRTE